MRHSPASWFLAGCALLMLVASVGEMLRRYRRSYGLYPAAEAWKGYFYEPPAYSIPKKEINRVEEPRP